MDLGAGVVVIPEVQTPHAASIAPHGWRVADIAIRLQLATASVRSYLSDAITKTMTRNRLKAALAARREGWL